MRIASAQVLGRSTSSMPFHRGSFAAIALAAGLAGCSGLVAGSSDNSPGGGDDRGSTMCSDECMAGATQCDGNGQSELHDGRDGMHDVGSADRMRGERDVRAGLLRIAWRLVHGAGGHADAAVMVRC